MSTNTGADEVGKSRLLLEARLLWSQGRVDEAADKFAEAAEAEEQSAAAAGDRADGWRHTFSAAGCWAQAGNFYAAITLGDQLLAEPDLPAELRQQVAAYLTAIRARRDQWSAGLPAVGASGS